MQREFREQGAERFEHPPVVGVGREDRPAEFAEIHLGVGNFHFDKNGLAASVAVVRLLGVHFFEHLQEQKIGNLRDVGDGVGDVGFPHYLAETFEQILQRGIVHMIMRRQLGRSTLA